MDQAQLSFKYRYVVTSVLIIVAMPTLQYILNQKDIIINEATGTDTTLHCCQFSEVSVSE